MYSSYTGWRGKPFFLSENFVSHFLPTENSQIIINKCNYIENLNDISSCIQLTSCVGKSDYKASS